ncbi:hypothetical protein ACE1TI_03170 [Alteribacillus sp. JSM 102045]|uniref:hypothetical protein n=1 Tax=Alteribacillus sp. JSM 102045 TaxID=1562101 RepID=UPI0035C126A2
MTDKRMNKRHNSKRPLIRGVGTGFLIAFIGTLLTSPMKGSTLRQKTVNRFSLFKNYPTKAVAAYRGRKEKFRELGHTKYEHLQEEINSLKEEACSSEENEKREGR